MWKRTKMVLTKIPLIQRVKFKILIFLLRSCMEICSNSPCLTKKMFFLYSNLKLTTLSRFFSFSYRKITSETCTDDLSCRNSYGTRLHLGPQHWVSPRKLTRTRCRNILLAHIGMKKELVCTSYVEFVIWWFTTFRLWKYP